jgi:hypothetical protein
MAAADNKQTSRAVSYILQTVLPEQAAEQQTS